MALYHKTNFFPLAEENVGDNAQYPYTGSSSLWTVNIGTGESKKLFTGDAVQPQWSTQGDRIVYLSSAF
jgi:hypothetical protein